MTQAHSCIPLCAYSYVLFICRILPRPPISTEFKSSEPTAQLQSIGTVVKAYQVEVDQLTRRAKAAQAAFLALYKFVYDMAEPTAALAAAVVCVSAASDAYAKNFRVWFSL